VTRLRFSKMHGLGNDFMVIDALTQEINFTPEQISAWADRHTGIGFDQLLLVCAPSDPAADFRYRIFNADGSEAEQCGNGARCIALFVQLNDLASRDELVWQTSNGRIITRYAGDGQVEVDMGEPRLQPAQIPVLATPDPESYCVQLCTDDQSFAAVPVSIGNPHAVLFVDSVVSAPVTEVGAKLTRHPLFPEGANIEFCEVVEPGFIRLRVFERGVGETRACGSGACAAVVAGILTERLRDRVKVSLPGGKIRINWGGPGQSLKMTGPATLVYDGSLEIA